MLLRALCLAAACSLALRSTPAAQIVASDREASVSTFALGGVFQEDPVFDSDAEETRFYGPFASDLDAAALGLGVSATAEAEQTSSVDPAASTFDAEGLAFAGMALQGNGLAEGVSRVELSILLASAGTLVLTGTLDAANQFGALVSNDDHGSAVATLRVTDEITGTDLFVRTVQIGQSEVTLQGEVVPLGVGRYTLTLSAEAMDATVGIEQVNGSVAFAEYDIQGSVTGTGPLSADVPSVSLASGGTQQLSLSACGNHAGEVYLVLGTAGATAPGTLVDSVVLPLTTDMYSIFTLTMAGGSILAGTLGVLSGAGTGSAAIHVPTGLDPGLAGAVLHHAYLTFDALGAASLASNPVPLALVP